MSALKRTVMMRSPDRVRRMLRPLRGAAEAGDLAEQAVERHRGEGHADHADGDAGGQESDARIGAVLAGARSSRTILTMVMT